MAKKNNRKRDDTLFLTKEQYAANHKAAADIDKANEIRRLYAETADRDMAIQRAYNEGRAISNDFATQTRGQQDRLHKLVSENGDLIKSSFGNDAYNALKKDSQTMQDSVYRKYYADYMNTSDYQKDTYDNKQKYLTEQENEAKKTKWVSIIGGLMNAAASASVSQYPTKTNQAMAQGFYENTEKAVEATKEASKRQQVYNQYKTDLFNEEYTKKNLELINSDKELKNLVNEAYEAKEKVDANFDPTAMYNSGGVVQIGYSANVERQNNAYEAIKKKGFSDEEVNNLIDAYTREQNRLDAEAEAKKVKKFADKHPALASATYVGANVLQIGAVPEILQSGIENAVNGEYKPMDVNSAGFTATRFRENVSQTVSENIQQEVQNKTNSEFWTRAASFAYQTGLSMGDFLSLSVLPEPVSLAIMGTSAGVTAVKDATDRGVSADQALVYGVFAGAAEAFFERFSLENLNALKATDKTGVFNYVRNVLKQQFTEGSEEVFTDVANAISDQIINGNASELARQYQALVEKYNGDTDKAWKELAKNFGLQLAESYAGGALSGGIIGMYGGAVGNYRLSSIGKSVSANTEELNSLINIASALPADSKAAKLVKQMNTSTNVTNAKVGELYVNTLNDVTESFNKAETMSELTNEFATVSENAGDYNGSLLTEFARSYQENAKRIVETEQRAEKKAAKINAKTNANTADTNTAAESDGAATTAKNDSKAETITATAETKKNTFALPVTIDSTGNNAVITSVHSTKGGDVRFTTVSGETVSVNDITAKNQHFADIVNDAVLETKDNVALGANGASLYIQKALDANLNSSEYVAFKNYAKQAYLLGVGGANWTSVAKQNAAVISRLGTTTARQFYDAGVADNNALTEIRESNKRSQKTGKQTVQKTGDGTFTNETNDASLDEVFKAVAKKLHINVKYVTDANGNGSFDAATATLTVVQGAKRGDATTLAHEIGEYGRAYNYDAYKQYVDTVINMLMEMDAISTTEDILAYHKTYHNGETNTTIQDAKEELVNDVTARLFFAEGGIEEAVKFVKDSKNISAEEKHNFFDTLKSIINHIVDVISKHVTNKGLRSSEKAVADMSLNDIKALRKQFISVIDGAISNLENGVKVTGVSSYSLNLSKSKESKYIVRTINDNYEEIDKNDKFNITSDEQKIISSFNHQSDYILDIFDKQGNVAKNKQLGNVELVKSGAKSTIHHGFGKIKLAAAKAIKPTIENGNIIHLEKNYQQKNMDRYVIAAKGFIDGQSVIVGVIVHTYPTQKNVNAKFYLHEAEIIEAGLPFKTAPQLSVDTVSKSASNSSISNSDENVKKSLDVDTDGNKLSAEQQEYFADSKIRDEDGRLLVVYHGTNNREETETWDEKTKTWNTEYKPFNVFKTPEWVDTNSFFFTDNQNNAGGYGSSLYSVYLNVKKPLIIECSGQNYSNIKFNGLEYDTYEWAEYAKKNGYDGVIFNNIIDGAGYEYFESPVNEYAVFDSKQIKRTDNTKPTKNSDIRFSLDVPVEESKDLIAVHNISEEKLLKSLRLGGLPMPSIAVARAEYGHTGFGKISLVFPKTTIDPSNRNNDVYSGDAYTPTYPHIEYKLSSKASDIYNRALALKGAPFYKSVRYAPDNVLDRIERLGYDDFIKAETEGYGLKQLYLYETTGTTVPMQYSTNRNELDADTVALYDYIAEKMGDAILNEDGLTGREWSERFYEEYKKTYKDYYKTLMPLTDEEAENVFNNRYHIKPYVLTEVSKIRNYLRNGAVTEETVEDANKTEELIDNSINAREYRQWVRDFYDGIIEKEGIRNDRDIYNPSGSRRSFEALHYEHTLENVVRAMKESGKQGIGALGMNIFGASKVQYNSVAEIKANADKLIDGADEEQKARYNEQREELSHRFFELASSLPKESGSFLANDDASNVLIEAVLNYSTKTGMDNYIRRELQGWANYSPSIVDDLMAIVDDIRALPTAYFEAKPQRAVEFNEVYTAIIPDNSSKELIDALTAAGVKYETYKNGDDKARVKALNSLESVKFSKDVEDDASVSSIIKENKQLQKSLDYYKMMSKRNTGHKVSRSEIRRIAADLKNSWTSTMTVDEIAEELAALYDHISSGNATWGTIELMGKTLGKELVESSKSELDPETSEVRDYLKSLEISLDDYQEADVRYLYENMRTWINGIRKGVKYRKDGIKLDDVWQEMSSMYPYIFAPDTNSQDQPAALYEAVQELYSPVDNSYGYDDNELAEMIMLDIYDKYYDIPEVVTPVDRANKKLNQERAESRRRLEEVKAKDKERYEKKIAEVKEKYDKNLDRKQQRISKLEADIRYRIDRNKERSENRRKSALRERILKDTNTLSKWLAKPNKENSVPTELQKPLFAFLTAINFTNEKAKNEEKMTRRWQDVFFRLHSAFSVINSAEDVSAADTAIKFPPNVMNALKDLAEEYEDENISIYDMSVSDLTMLKDTIAVIKNTITQSHKLLANERTESLEALGADTISEIGDMKRLVAKNSRLKSMLLFDFADATSVMRMLGDAGGSVIKSLRNAHNRQVGLISIAKNAMEDIVEDVDTKTWSGRKAELKQFNLEAGGDIALTPAQIMDLYLLSKRDQAKEHLLGGGITLSNDIEKVAKGKVRELNKKNNKNRQDAYDSIAALATANKLSVNDIANIVGTLTDEQKKVADAIQKFMATTCAAWGNEITQKLYGYDGYTERDYVPIVSCSDFIRSMDSNAPDNVSYYAVANQGFTKATVKHANNPIVVGDLFEVFADHINNMILYNAYTIPLSDAMKWINFKTEETSIKNELRKTYGDGAEQWLLNLFKDLNGVKSKAYSDDAMGQLISRSKGAKVAFNARVAIQQPTAFLKASLYLPEKYMVKAAATSFTKGRQGMQRAKEHCPIALWKSWGFFDTNIGPSMTDLLLNRETGLQKLEEFGMKGAELGDAWTWGVLWNACEYYVQDTRSDLEIDSAAYYSAVSDKLSEIIDNTQVVDSPFHRTQIMRSKGTYAKLVTAFMAEPMKSYNMLKNATLDVIQGKQGAKKFALKTAYVYAITQIAVSAAAALVDGFRKDDEEDDEKNWWQRYWKRFAEAFKGNLLGDNFLNPEAKWWQRYVLSGNLSPLGLLPFAKDWLSVIDGYDVSRMDMDIASDLINAFKTFDSDKATPYQKAYQATKLLSDATGLPISNATRTFKSVYNIFSKEKMGKQYADKERYKQLYDYKVSGDKKNYDRVYAIMQKNGKDDDSIMSGIKTAYAENDTRVAMGAIAYVSGDMDGYIDYLNQIANDYDEEFAKKVIASYANWLKNAKYALDEKDEEGYADYLEKALSSGVEQSTVENAIKGIDSKSTSDSDEAKMLYKWTDIYAALDSGQSSAYQQMYQDALDVKVANGKSKAEAQEEIKKKIQGYYKQDYIDNESKRSAIESKLNRTGLFSQDDYNDWVAQSFNGTENMKKAFEGGLDSTRKYVYDRVQAKVKGGMAEDSAKYGIRTSISNAYKQEFINGDANTRARIITYMANTGIYGSRQDVIAYINKNWLK